MLLKYLLFFILLTVVWRLVSRRVVRSGTRPEDPTVTDGRPRSSPQRRRGDVDDAEFEILPEEGTEPD